MDTMKKVQVGELTLHVISDTHLEWHKDKGKEFLESLDSQDADVLVLAGDISGGSGLTETLESLSNTYPEVAFVLGNHDYYGCADPFEVATQAQKIADRFSNVHLLNRSAIEIKGQRIVGATLWFRLGVTAQLLLDTWPDFAHIPDFEEFVKDAGWQDSESLKEMVKEGDIVVTHHLPTYQSVPARYIGHKHNLFFVNDLENTIAYQEPALWIHGHTHDKFDYRVANTRILSHPFGYPWELK